MARKLCADTLGRGCYRVLALDDFHRDKQGQGGRRSLCRDCANALKREKYEHDPTPMLAANRRWAISNPEKVAAKNRRYYEEHRDEALEYARRAWAERGDEIRARRRERAAERRAAEKRGEAEAA